ncbi:MAG: hypothetical protein J0I14_17755 [Propionibacteriaceae bacterium]|nr:hypothetical protein [Propionibacteriaceae bacterium]
MKHIAVLDEGTTSTRAVLIAADGSVVTEKNYKVDVHTPGGTRVEQDPKQIVDRSVQALREVLDQARDQGWMSTASPSPTSAPTPPSWTARPANRCPS